MQLKHYSLIFFAYIFFVCVLNGQPITNNNIINKYNFKRMAELDSFSLNYYLNKNLQGLENLCINAHQENIEVFNLFFRTGILHFQNKNYSSAIFYLETAYQSNPSEPFLKDYLYYSYVLSGRLQNAKQFAFKQDKNFLKKINLKKTIFNKIGYTFLNNLSDNISNNEKAKLIITNPPNNEDYEAWGTIFGPSMSHIITLQQDLFKNHLIMNYLVGIFNVPSMGIDQLATQPYPLDKYISRTQNMSNISYQFAGSGLFFLDKGWVLGAGYSSCLINYSYILTALDNKINYGNESGSALGFLIGKRFKNIQAQLQYGSLDLFDKQTQTMEGSLLYFPFGDIKFYGQTKVAFTNTSDSLESDNIIITQMFGGKLSNWLWLTANLAYGRHTNYVTDLSMSTFNTAHPILMQGGINLKFIIKKLELGLGYTYQQREQTFNHDKLPFFNRVYQKSNYSLNQITTSILWNF